MYYLVFVSSLLFQINFIFPCMKFYKIFMRDLIDIVLQHYIKLGAGRTKIY